MPTGERPEEKPNRGGKARNCGQAVDKWISAATLGRRVSFRRHHFPSCEKVSESTAYTPTIEHASGPEHPSRLRTLVPLERVGEDKYDGDPPPLLAQRRPRDRVRGAAQATLPGKPQGLPGPKVQRPRRRPRGGEHVLVVAGGAP